MSVFHHDYSRYYDLLYAEKDYHGEAKYVSKLIRSKGRKMPAAILELGCGTGCHAMHLAALGHAVHGIDRSPAMIEYARQRASQALGRLSRKVSFTVGDIARYSCCQKFDAVVSLFHVICYQTTNNEVVATLKTAARHLRPGGMLVFDVWYGPAVLEQKPSVRIKRFADSQENITRTAEAVLHSNENTVEVHYSIQCVAKDSGRHREIKESHVVRYFFLPELELMLGLAGFRLEKAEEWMTGATPSPATWGVTIVARKSRSASFKKERP